MLSMASLFVYFIDIHGWLIRQFTHADDVTFLGNDESKMSTISSNFLSLTLTFAVFSNAVHVLVYCRQLHGP